MVFHSFPLMNSAILNRTYTVIKESIHKTHILNPVRTSLKNKTFIVTGGHYGIGYSIASSIASYGANVVLLDTCTRDDKKYKNNIYTAAEKITEMTQKPNCIAIDCNITHKNHIEYALQETVDIFGGINGIVMNASSTNLYDTLHVSESAINNMTYMNIKGNFLLGQKYIRYASKRGGGRILAISPPLSYIDTKHYWVPHLYYSMSMMNVTMMLKTWNAEFSNIHVNSVWPVEFSYSSGLNKKRVCNKREQSTITGEAIKHLLCADAELCSGHHFTDESIVRWINNNKLN